MRFIPGAAALLLASAQVFAQPAISEPSEFPATRPGPNVFQTGRGCFHLASGTITPGDVDWVQVTLPRATTQTVVDVDFPANGGGSALLASIIGGSTFFNMSDNNNTRDALCGLSSATFPVGSTADSAVNLAATNRNIVVNIGITGAQDTGFVGNHAQSFSYDVWVYAATVPCTMDADCGDGVACTADTCDVALGDCFNDADDLLCDNGRFCDGVEFCHSTLGCRSGARPDCDDGVGCTIDECDAALDDCVNLPDDGFCDDEEFCDGEEFCDVQFDCQFGPPPTCDDGVDCTQDRCDLGSDSCVHAPDDGFCDDGRFCNGVESCDAINDCQDGVPPVCDDSVACTVDSCDVVLDDCVFNPDDSRCDNGVFCDGAEFCDEVAGCLGGGEACPGMLCRESDDRCVECLADADCDDGDFCNGAETCDPTGACVDGVPPCPPDMICNAEARRCESGLFTLDVKPGVCPNRLTVMGQGTVMAAVTGAPGADVRKIDRGSLRLARADGVGASVAPQEGPPGPHSQVQDAATPFDGTECGCHALAGDGFPDLVLHFSAEALRTAMKLDGFSEDTTLELRVSGRLTDGTGFHASDCVVIQKVGKKPKDK